MREAVPATPRRKMTVVRKKRIYAQREGLCAWCGKPVECFGPGVIYDHYTPLALGGSDEDDNIRPLHARPCDKIKTAFDAKRIAKLRRQQNMAKPRKPSRLRSRGFPSDWTRRFNGTVVARSAANRGGE